MRDAEALDTEVTRVWALLLVINYFYFNLILFGNLCLLRSHKLKMNQNRLWLGLCLRIP